MFLVSKYEKITDGGSHDNKPVNIGLCNYIEVHSSMHTITFRFSDGDAVFWQYDNKQDMEEEYERIMKIIGFKNE